MLKSHSPQLPSLMGGRVVKCLKTFSSHGPYCTCFCSQSFINENQRAYLFVCRIYFLNRKYAPWGEGILSAWFFSIPLGLRQCKTLKKGGKKGRGKRKGKGRWGGRNSVSALLSLVSVLELDHHNNKPSKGVQPLPSIKLFCILCILPIVKREDSLPLLYRYIHKSIIS